MSNDKNKKNVDIVRMDNLVKSIKNKFNCKLNEYLIFLTSE